MRPDINLKIVAGEAGKVGRKLMFGNIVDIYVLEKYQQRGVWLYYGC